MGLYDTIYFKCKRCGETIDKQTKHGECLLSTFDSREVPTEIARCVIGDFVKCNKCNTKHEIVSTPPSVMKLDLVVDDVDIKSKPAISGKSDILIEYQESLETTFNEYYTNWRRETAMCSGIEAKRNNENFKKIVAMGEKIIPIILKEIKKNPSHLFLVLPEITKENIIIPEEDQGNIRKINELWIQWAELYTNYLKP